MSGGSAPVTESRLEIAFDDNRLVPVLYGEHNSHLARLEHLLGVSLVSRGNTLTVRGSEDAVQRTAAVLRHLWQRLLDGGMIGAGDFDSAVQVATAEPAATDAADALRHTERPELAIRTRKRLIVPRTPAQAGYVEALRRHELVFGLGPAGTGKTYLAVAQAVLMLTTGGVDRLILSRPAIEAGERLGFLPGDMREKVDPYLRPLYDALHDMLPAEQVARGIETGAIEIAPLAFMRGRTLSNAFIILDEAQNTTAMQMRMFLTRIGENSRMAVTGDPSQTDLPQGERSGLHDAIAILQDLEGVGFVWLSDRDVVRHALVTRIVRAYDALDRRSGAAQR